MNPDGTGHTRITNNTLMDAAPVLAADPAAPRRTSGPRARAHCPPRPGTDLQALQVPEPHARACHSAVVHATRRSRSRAT